MSHNIQMPDELQHVVKERRQIWSDLDKNKNQAAQLKRHLQEVGGKGKTTSVEKPFTSSDNPMDEINQVISKVNHQMGELKSAENEISRTQREIEEIQQKARNMMMMAGGGAAVVIIGLFLMIAGG